MKSKRVRPKIADGGHGKRRRAARRAGQPAPALITSAEYEGVVCKLVTALVNAVNGLPPDHVGSGPKNKIRGVSGHQHQIDVSIRTDSELHLIECKYWSRRISDEAVLTLFGRRYDIQAANPSLKVFGALATRKGIQIGAKQIASHYEIILQHVVSPSEFALRYKNQVHLGTTDSLGLSDKLILGVERASSENRDH